MRKALLLLLVACSPLAKPIVYVPDDQRAGAGAGSATPTAWTAPPPDRTMPGDRVTTGDKGTTGETAKAHPVESGRREFEVKTLPMSLVLHRGTLLWTDLAGAVWAMPADGSTPPKQLADQHREGFATHLFVAGDRVFAKSRNGLLAIDVPDGPVKRLNVTGMTGMPEVAVGDAASLYVTIFERDPVLRVPADGGAAKHVVDMPHGVLAVHGDTLYIASFSNGTLVSVPVGGGKPHTIAKKLARPTALAVDDHAAYVYSKGDERVTRVDLESGATAVLGEKLSNSDELDLADEGIYTVSWPNMVVRIPKTPGASVTLADDLFQPRAIVSDERFLYVTSDQPPRIVRVEKKK